MNQRHESRGSFKKVPMNRNSGSRICASEAVCGILLAAVCLGAGEARGQIFQLPTANRYLFDRKHQERFFAPTPGRDWESGTFGCVRNNGWRMHEGIDIRCLQHDARGEPADVVRATAGGVVAYVNRQPHLSNYGNYIILQHQIDGLEIYSLYAHLSQIRSDLRQGAAVSAGQPIGIMGRTTNTREQIGRERAHLHFELNLLINDRFPQWFKINEPGERNDHGLWNGRNLLGLDPRIVFLQQEWLGRNFNLLQFVRNQTELCRVFVHKADFPWVRRYTALVRRNPLAEKEGVAGYEISLNFNGLPYQLIPRAPSEVRIASKFHLLYVNAAEAQKNPCRKLVQSKGGRWEFGPQGMSLLDLLVFN